MISARAFEAIGSIRCDRDKLVWATPDTFYKLFWGLGGATRQPAEIAACKAASECRVWGPYCLPVEGGRFSRLLRSRRGLKPEESGAGNDQLQAFLDCRYRAAAAGSPLASALELMELRKLRMILGTQQYEAVMNRVRPALSTLLLPAGPVHGDLHRGNIVAVGGRLFLIDWDRYNPRSSPVFDKIHFSLTERRRLRRLPWLSLLEESEDILLSSMALLSDESPRPASLALAYGLNRIALEAYDAQMKRQRLSRFHEFTERLLGTFARRACRESEPGKC